MPNQPNRLAEVMRAEAKRMRAEFEASEVINHSGSKGSWRESLVRELLQKNLPGHIRTMHGGEVVATNGEVSAECDIVLYDRSTPPFLGGDAGGVVPTECVYGVVEVKTYLSKAELFDACQKLSCARRLPKTAYRPVATRPHYRAYGQEWTYYPTTGMVFAFNGPSLESTADNVRAWIRERSCEEWPDSVWVLGKGYISWWNPDLRMMEMSPSPNSQLTCVEVSQELDILLPFALNLNVVLGHATMAPLNLLDYASDTSLGIPTVWTDD